VEDGNFGLWSGKIPEHVATRKAMIRIQEGGRRSGRRSSHGLCASLAPIMQAGLEGVDKELCTRRAAVANCHDSVPSTRNLHSSPFHQACTLVRFNFV